MEPGDKCICQEDDWHCAFGDVDIVVHRGMRLRVSESRIICGQRFYTFEETPKGNYYLSLGFKPLRSLH